MSGKRTKSRTTIGEDWKPDAAGMAFAENLGVPIEQETDKFRDYHLANGSLMLSWPAAWRTWCRNAVRFEKIRKPAPPILAEIDASDPWGIVAWSKTLRDTEIGTVQGRAVLTVNGIDVVGAALDVLDATGWPRDLRPDLTPIAIWLRDDIDPDVIVHAIASSTKHPDNPTLRYYDGRVRRAHERQNGALS